MSIEIKNVSYTYSPGTDFARTGIQNINLRVEQGEWVAMMGPSGSGKSTLLQHFNGLMKPQKGTVLIDGNDIHSSKEQQRLAAKRIGLVFQYPEHQLFGATVLEEVSYAPENFGFDEGSLDEIIREAMLSVGLEYDKYINRSPQELSGGEKRRVALAGVLAAKPQVLALDEPTAGLDFDGRKKLLKTITKLNKEMGISVIWVTHEISDLVELVDRIVVMHDGRIELDGKPREAVYHPILKELGLDRPLAVQATTGLYEAGHTMEGHPVNNYEFIRAMGKVLK